MALFAVVAQLALGVASAQHQARMLAAGPDAWEEICTPSGIEYVRLDSLLDGPPPDDGGTRLSGGLHCAVCAAALLDPLPGAATPNVPLGEPGGSIARALPATPRLASALQLRPPVRAPPLLS